MALYGEKNCMKGQGLEQCCSRSPFVFTSSSVYKQQPEEVCFDKETYRQKLLKQLFTNMSNFLQ